MWIKKSQLSDELRKQPPPAPKKSEEENEEKDDEINEKGVKPHPPVVSQHEETKEVKQDLETASPKPEQSQAIDKFVQTGEQPQQKPSVAFGLNNDELFEEDENEDKKRDKLYDMINQTRFHLKN